MRPLLGTYLRRSILLRMRLLDIQNISDEKCFNPFVLALFFPVWSIQHPNHVTKNIRYEYGLNLDGTASPASLKGIYRFEKQSHAISVNVYGYEDKKFSHPQITQNKKGYIISTFSSYLKQMERHVIMC